LSDRPDAGGLQLAEQLGISTAALRPKDFPDRDSFDHALADIARQFSPQLLVLAGYMRILSPGFIERFSGQVLNIHPSLLPKYRGLHTHRRALDADDSVHGATVHFVTPELDGGPAVIQGEVRVRRDDTEESLSARVQRMEHRIYPQAVGWIASGRLKLQDGAPWLDGQPLTSPVIVRESDDAAMFSAA
jgi:phosphoribosylglycinamide formyltransferase-1